MLRRDLEKFFAGRTVGHAEYMGGWHWRGEGYDEGWEPMTDAEVQTMYELMYS